MLRELTKEKAYVNCCCSYIYVCIFKKQTEKKMCLFFRCRLLLVVLHIFFINNDMMVQSLEILCLRELFAICTLLTLSFNLCLCIFISAFFHENLRKTV